MGFFKCRPYKILPEKQTYQYALKEMIPKDLPDMHFPLAKKIQLLNKMSLHSLSLNYDPFTNFTKSLTVQNTEFSAL